MLLRSATRVARCARFLEREGARQLLCRNSALFSQTTLRASRWSSSVAVAEERSWEDCTRIPLNTLEETDDSTKRPIFPVKEKIRPERPPSPCVNHSSREDTLPPPLPEPKYSVRRRVLPPTLKPLNSPAGRRFLLQTLEQGMAAPYLPLTEHFMNQSDPAYCGVTTLVIVLNALAVDPQVRWKGGWRYFGSEDVLLTHCCLQEERIRRVGISMDEFAQLGSCQGLQVTMKRPPVATSDNDRVVAMEEEKNIDDFRRDLQAFLQDTTESTTDQDSMTDDKPFDLKGIVVVSFSRAALGQTGEGHFSPVAAYHAATDQVLILDVARFKYQPYWVAVEDLYQAMCPLDETTGQPRGWYLLRPPGISASYKGSVIDSEDRRPAELVPQVGQASLCPVQQIKIDYCKVRQHSS